MSKRIEIHLLKGYISAIFIVAPFTLAKKWKQHNCPSTDEWRQARKCKVYLPGIISVHLVMCRNIKLYPPGKYKNNVNLKLFKRIFFFKCKKNTQDLYLREYDSTVKKKW